MASYALAYRVREGDEATQRDPDKNNALSPFRNFPNASAT
jgi:hypothetical protein